VSGVLSTMQSARSSRIREAWDRATAIGLLGAFWLAAEEFADNGMVVSTDAQESTPLLHR